MARLCMYSKMETRNCDSRRENIRTPFTLDRGSLVLFVLLRVSDVQFVIVV
jgi:hypothetical protein